MYKNVAELEALRDKLLAGDLHPSSLNSHVSSLINSQRDMIRDQSRKIAQHLIFQWDTYSRYRSENPRTKNTTVALALFNGGCQAAHAIGYGATTHQVSTIVRSALATSHDGGPLDSAVVEALAGYLEQLYNAE